MNWTSFLYGTLTGSGIFVGISAGVSYYVLKHPAYLTRYVMKNMTKSIRKAA